MVCFCLRVPVSLKYAKTNSPATICQFKNAPEIPFPTPNSTVPCEMQVTAAGLSRQLVRLPVTVLLALPLSVRQGTGAGPWSMATRSPGTRWTRAPRLPVANRAGQGSGKRPQTLCFPLRSISKSSPRIPCLPEASGRVQPSSQRGPTSVMFALFAPPLATKLSKGAKSLVAHAQYQLPSAGRELPHYLFSSSSSCLRESKPLLTFHSTSGFSHWSLPSPAFWLTPLLQYCILNCKQPNKIPHLTSLLPTSSRLTYGVCKYIFSQTPNFSISLTLKIYPFLWEQYGSVSNFPFCIPAHY